MWTWLEGWKRINSPSQSVSLTLSCLLCSFNELCKEAKEGNEDGDADSGLAGKLAAAGKADGAKYVRRQRPEKDNHKEEGAASTTANEAARVVEVAAELEQPADSATRRKGGIKKSVTRKAVKSYKIYRWDAFDVLPRRRRQTSRRSGQRPERS